MRELRSKVRKHRGIHQTGGKAGKLKKGYKYSSKRLKNGKAKIIKVQVGGPRNNNNERIRKQLIDKLYIISPKDRYDEWKRVIPSYEYQLRNSKLSKQDIEKKKEYIKTFRPAMLKYEKENNIVRDSVEMLQVYTMEQLEQEISEMKQKIKGILNRIKEASSLIYDIKFQIRLDKLNNDKLKVKKHNRILKKAEQTMEEKKQELEPLFDRLRIFINRKKVLEDERENMDKAFQHSFSQVGVPNRKKVLKDQQMEIMERAFQQSVPQAGVPNIYPEKAFQIGGKAGKLKKGYKYSGKRLKNGKAKIVKCKSKKC